MTKNTLNREAAPQLLEEIRELRKYAKVASLIAVRLFECANTLELLGRKIKNSILVNQVTVKVEGRRN